MKRQTIAKKMLLAITPVIFVFVLGILLLSRFYHLEINQANNNKITTILDLVAPLVELQLSLGNLDEIAKIIRAPSQQDGIVSITVSDTENHSVVTFNAKTTENKNQVIKEHRRDIVQFFGSDGRLKIGEIILLEDTTWGTRKLTQIQEIALPSLMISFVALWLLIRVFNREITQPAKRIEKAINNIARGDFDFEFTPTSNNELRSLEDMVINLLASLKHNQEMQIEMQNMRAQTTLALESKRVRTEFLAHLSHEIKSPLNTICGYLDIVAEAEAEPNAPLDPRNALRIKSMQKTATHLRALVNDMLDFTSLESKRKTLDIKETGLWSLIESICLLHLETALANNSTINTLIDPSVPEFGLITESSITKALSNLISNAVKFTHDGEITLWARMNDGYVVIDVQDTGIGIPKEQIASIFDAFVQADNSTTKKYEGTGLGLAIAKMEAERIGGELVCVFSEQGQGSIFRLSFPVGNAREKRQGVERSNTANVAIFVKSENQHQTLRGAFIRAGAEINADTSRCDIIVCDVSREHEARSKAKQGSLTVVIDPTQHIASGDEPEDLPLTQRVSVITTQDALQMIGAESYAAKERRKEAARSQKQDARILAVDDEETSLDILCWNLNKIGIRTITKASNARDALQYASAHDFDILITDLHMPGMDGFELIAKIREIKPDVIIYVVSADSQKKNIERLQNQLGVAHVIGKPYTIDDLRRLTYSPAQNAQVIQIDPEMEAIRQRYFAGLEKSMNRLQCAIDDRNKSEALEILHAMIGTASMVEDFSTLEKLKTTQHRIKCDEWEKLAV